MHVHRWRVKLELSLVRAVAKTQAAIVVLELDRQSTQYHSGSEAIINNCFVCDLLALSQSLCYLPIGGTIPISSEICTFFFVPVITFPPFLLCK